MNKPRTLFEKIWDDHAIATDESGQTLLYVDSLVFAESSFNEFDVLHFEGFKVRRPKQAFGVADHYTSSKGLTLAHIVDDERRNMVLTLERNAREGGFKFFGLDDPWRGIQHLVGPEQGIAQPGVILLCIDSHAATQGAVGALAYGVGGDLDHALATQTIWQRKPKQMRINVEGKLGTGVASKDVILAILAKIGTDGGVQHAIEYAGSVIRDLSVEERMTVTNMSIEAGSPAGTIAPDRKTFDYVKGRPYAPRDGAPWEAALAYWKTLPSDADAHWDRQVTLDGDAIEPMVTWGNSPEDGVPITGAVPDPGAEPDARRRAGMERSLDYMDLRPGTRMTDIAVDQVFIGSCTNSRLDDLRAAARIVKGRKVVVPALAVAGSAYVKRQAEAEGLDRIFREAGFSWGEAGCSMCISLNGDVVHAGKRCASTSNRNFRGRQGQGSRTHLVSPVMAAAAAVTGRLTDVRDLIK